MVNSGSFSKGVMMATEKPNVVLILADDVDWFDVGATPEPSLSRDSTSLGGREGSSRPRRRPHP
jgi:hypothetical protein